MRDVPLDAFPVAHGALGDMIFGMRKLLPAFALVASTVSVPAFAADWVFVTTGGMERDHYVDRTSIRQVGSYKQAWGRIDYPDPRSGEDRMLALTEYDCSGRRYRPLQLTTYYRNGQNVSNPGDRVWAYVPPDSVVESQLEYVCFGRLPQ